MVSMMTKRKGTTDMNQIVVEFNSTRNKWEARQGKRILSSCNTKDAVLRKLKTLGLSTEVASAETIAPVAKKSEFSVNERFTFIEQFVGMIARKSVPSLIITGNGGIGKTYTVTETLRRLGKKEMSYGIDYEPKYDWLLIKGFSTAKALYRTLFENNGKTIVFDDCDSVFKDPIAANILKGALDSGEKRVISWGAEIRGEDDLPSRFEFHGQVIFISNLPQSKFPQALLSRSLRVDLTLNTEEVVERIEEILYKEVAVDGVDEIVAFVKKHAKQATDLNIRSAMTLLKIRSEVGRGWERLAQYNFTAQ